MENTTGTIAKNVCKALDQHGPLSLAGLTLRLRSGSPHEVIMAVGWLNREDKVELERHADSIKVSLK